MAIVSKDKLRESLREHKIEPVYLLFGPETFLRDLAVKTIADRTFSAEDLRDFNESEINLSQPDDLKTALASAEQLPMMSRRRLIRIKNVRISTSGRSDTVRDEHEKLLKAFLDRPPEHSVVIFIADELSGTRKLTKVLKQKCFAVEFASLNDNDRVKWADARFKDLGSEIDDRSMRHLIRLTGSDLNRLSNEIDKVSTAALPERHISIDVIDDLVANTGAIGQWDLLNHLAAGRKVEALSTLKKMLDDGDEPLMILGQIAGSLRRSAIDGRTPTHRAARQMKRLAETDVAIKTSVGGSGPSGARMHLEKLVCELTLI